MRTRSTLGLFAVAACSILALVSVVSAAKADTAKEIFGAQHSTAAMSPASIGFYSKGCLAGGAELPVDGPTWQAMRLSRDRHYGHPVLVNFLEKLSREAAQRGIWPGLLVGDMAQPRGGPLPYGHASHQIGLDADVWFRPMPNDRLSRSARETYPFRSVLKEGTFEVDDRVWNDHYRDLLKLTASDPKVQRIFIHPGIKKKLCETAGRDRGWLNKMRPYYGHHEHFHIRLFCQPGSPNCDAQHSTGTGDGCDKLDWWFNVALQPPKPGAKPPKPKPPMMLADLPRQCRAVLTADAPGHRAVSAPNAGLAYAPVPASAVPIPTARPLP